MAASVATSVPSARPCLIFVFWHTIFGMTYILKSVVKIRPHNADILRSLSEKKRNRYFSDLITRHPLNLDKGHSERSDIPGVDTAVDVVITVAPNLQHLVSTSDPRVVSQYLARKIEKHPPKPPKPGDPSDDKSPSPASAEPTTVNDEGGEEGQR